MNGIREFLATTTGKVVAAILVIAALGIIYSALKSTFGDSAIAAQSKQRIMVDSATGKSFETSIELGMTFPIKAPSDGMTGYPADETCTWTADGHVASEPTYVLLNKTVGKKGPTFCPVCHRLVVKDNPPAREGEKPPPTESEYAATHHGRSASGQE